jgi:DNA polymerase-3 subunit epsilon
MVNVIFDCETTGLPKSWGLPLSLWPRLVEFAAVKFEDGQPISQTVRFVVKPQGYYIPDSATQLHGISHSKAMIEGIPILEGLQIIEDFIKDADRIIAHNSDFDKKIVAREQIAAGMRPSFDEDKRIFCTKARSTNILKLKKDRGGGFKWPSLADLCHYCGVVNEDAHSALSDVMATYECYLAMRAKGHFL